MNCNIENFDNLELFNTKLLEFIDFLYSIIPNRNLIKLKGKIKLTLLYDKTTVMDLFITHIETYKNDILNEDENILLKVQQNILNNSIDLYNIYSNINNVNKITIWKYLKVFILLIE